jgi:hypothetical protein
MEIEVVGGRDRPLGRRGRCPGRLHRRRHQDRRSQRQSGLYSDITGQGSVWAARKAVEDYCKLRATIPAEQAFRPLAESDCPLVKK